jgi:hypothetical protein
MFVWTINTFPDSQLSLGWMPATAKLEKPRETEHLRNLSL